MDIDNDYSIPADRLHPFHATLLSTLEKLRPVYTEEDIFPEFPREKIDLAGLFSVSLSIQIDKLNATVKKRTDDRQKAINSISNSDIDSLIELFDRARIESISINDLMLSLEALSEQIITEFHNKDSNNA